MLSTCQLYISLTRTGLIYLEVHFCVELHTEKSPGMKCYFSKFDNKVQVDPHDSLLGMLELGLGGFSLSSRKTGRDVCCYACSVESQILFRLL